MSSLQGKDILVIDDAEDIRVLAKRILENDGANVYLSDSLESGVEAAVVREPHLIILDLQFPVKSGFDFLEIRKQHPQLSKTPVLVLSGQRDQASVSHAISLAANDYLIKPFRATLLLQKARKLLKVTSFHSCRLPEDKQIEIDVTVPGEIRQLSEAGFQLESYVKFDRNKAVIVKSEFFEGLPLEGVLIKTSSRPAHSLNGNRYLNTLNFTGVGEAFVKKLRKAFS